MTMTDIGNTKPNRVPNTGRKPAPGRVGNARYGWMIGAAVGILFCLIAMALVLPPLLAPSPSPLPGYELLAFQGVAATIVPGGDLLLESPDGKVAVYVPLGAYAGEGTLVLLPRPPELTPQGEGGTIYLSAIDLSMQSPDGSTLAGATFQYPILICYLLDGALVSLYREDPEALRVQSFDEQVAFGTWTDLEETQGWVPDQLCGTVSHLSLFALSVRAASPYKALPTSTPSVTGPYGVPSP